MTKPAGEVDVRCLAREIIGGCHAGELGDGNMHESCGSGQDSGNGEDVRLVDEEKLMSDWK